MKFNKKIFVLLCVLLLIVVAFTGCSKNIKKTSTQETAFKVLGADSGNILTISSLTIKDVKVSSSEGLFKAALTVDKTYNVTVKCDGYKDMNLSYKAVKRNNVYELKMERYLLDVEGYVIGDGSNPVSGVNVDIKELKKSVTTNSEGYYYITEVPAGVGEEDKYTLTFKKANFDDITKEVHICEKNSINKNISTAILNQSNVADSDTVERMVFSFDNINLGDIDPDSLKGNITGTVISSQGEIIEGALVTIKETKQSYVTDYNGVYEFNDVKIGNYELSISHSSYKSANKNIVVERDKTTTVDVTMSVLSDSSVSGVTAAGASITLDDGVNSYSSTADSEGKFNITGVVEGDNYNLSISHADYNSVSKKIVVNVKENTYVGTINLEAKPGKIKGQAPLNSTVSWNNSTVDITDSADLSFEFSNVPSGEQKVYVYLDNYNTKEIKVTVGANKTVDLGMVDLDSLPGSISGTVTSSTTGDGIPGVVVKLVGKSREVTTDSNGDYTFNEVNEGSFQLEYISSDFAKKTINVSVTKNQNTINDVVLVASPGSISGITIADTVVTVRETGDSDISDSDGNFNITGVAEGSGYNLDFVNSDYEQKNITVDVIRNQNTSVGQVSLTGKPGTIKGESLLNALVKVDGQSVELTDPSNIFFEFNDISNGQHTVTVSLADYETKEIKVTVGPNETLDLGMIDLTALPGSISGTVTSSTSGDGIAGVVVKLVGKNREVTTDSNGNYSFNEIDEGSCQLEFISNDFAKKTINVSITKNQNTTADVVLIANPGSVSGTTIPGTTVTVRETGDSATADSDGNFKVTGVAEGNGYHLDFDNDDYVLKTLTINIARNQNTSVGTVNLAGKPGTIEGEAPFLNTEIKLDSSSKITITDTTDFSFIYSDVSLGEHIISVSYPDYITSEIPVTIGPNDNIDLGNITLVSKPGNISGVVTDDSGTDLENVKVMIVETGEYTFTDSNGEYSFNDIEEDSYQLEYTLNGYSKLSVNINVAKNQTTTKNVQMIATPGSVSGITTPGSVNISMSGPASYSFTSNSNGNFSKSSIKPGIYSVTFSKSNYSSVTKTSVVIEKGLNTDVGTITLNALPGSISGTTTAYADVYFAGKHVQANSSGSWSITGVEPGTNTLRIEKTNYETFTKEYTVNINANTDTGTNTLVGLPGTVTGIIKSSLTSSGLEGATVTVTETGQSSITDSSGKYTISGINPGTGYHLEIKEADHVSGSDSFNISPNQTTNAGTVTLTVKTGSISGLTDPGTTSLNMSGPASYSFSSGSDGNFNKTGIKPGIYSVTFSKANYSSKTMNNISINPGANTDMSNINLNPLPGKITGILVDSIYSSTKIPGASISGAGATVTSNSSGYFVITNVTNGAHTLTITKDGYEEKNVSGINVGANQTVNLGNVELEGLASGIGDLDVTVYDESGNIISASVTLLETGTTVTSSSGVEFKDIPEGTYNIKATKSGFFSKTATATVLSDKTTNFSMDLISETALDDKGYVEGYVKSDEGNSKTGIIVSIDGYTSITGSDGYYIIMLPEGTYSSIVLYYNSIGSHEVYDYTCTSEFVSVTRNQTSRLDFTVYKMFQ